MKKVLSVFLLALMILSLGGCLRSAPRVKFIVDGEVIKTYSGPIENIEFPTPEEKDGMDFYGWMTVAQDDGSDIVTKESLSALLRANTTLKLYAVYTEKADNEKPNGEKGESDKEEKPDGTLPENPEKPGTTPQPPPENPPKQDEEKDDEDEDEDYSNVDNSGWT